MTGRDREGPKRRARQRADSTTSLSGKFVTLSMVQNMSTRNAHKGFLIVRRIVVLMTCAAFEVPSAMHGQSDTARITLPNPMLPPPPVVAKDPSLGTLLGVMMPGAGQFYAGKGIKGIAVLALAMTGAFTAASSWKKEGPYSNGGGLNNGQLGGAALFLSSWMFGFFTASSDVHDWNRAHRRP